MEQMIQLTLTIEEAKFVAASVGYAVASVAGKKEKAKVALYLMSVSRDAVDTVMPKMGHLTDTIMESIVDRANG